MDNEQIKPDNGQIYPDNEQISKLSSSYVRLIGIFTGMGFSLNIIIGSGIFVTPGDVWRLTGSPIVSLVFMILGGLISFLGCLIYAELGSMLPRGAGELRYLEEAFPNHRSIIAHTFSYAMLTEIRLLSVATLFIITLYNAANNKLAVHVNQTLAIFKVMAMFSFAVAGIIIGSNRYQGTNAFHSTINRNITPVEQIGSYADAMIKISYIMVVNPDDATINHDGDASRVIAVFFGDNLDKNIGRKLISAFISISSFGAVSSMCFTGARIIVYSSQSKFIPKYFAEWSLWFVPKYFAKWSFLFNTPTRALFAQFIYCAILIMFFPTSKH
ncbi:36531_t:CDS:2 [Racocetra persica]|uniref:36531_t:CDS:1 n=1 Tax=Racocetra persica TaxID=160502 RepID=A0ACA9KEM6_9GLOM|nr:36531_t:CDS:2 [Racocetra persica]